jgi:hypothetical protein
LRGSGAKFGPASNGKEEEKETGRWNQGCWNVADVAGIISGWRRWRRVVCFTTTKDTQNQVWEKGIFL